MSERSSLISKLRSDFKARAAYIQAKVATLVPSQIRALRLKSNVPRQPDLAKAAEMHQSRISALETAGANPTLSTLSAIAAALNVGLKVEFVPFSEMLAWENSFSQDAFNPTRLDQDKKFLGLAPIEQLQFYWGAWNAAATANLRTRSRLAHSYVCTFQSGKSAGAWTTNIEPEQTVYGYSRNKYGDLWGAQTTVISSQDIPTWAGTEKTDQPLVDTQALAAVTLLFGQPFSGDLIQQPLTPIQ